MPSRPGLFPHARMTCRYRDRPGPKQRRQILRPVDKAAQNNINAGLALNNLDLRVGIARQNLDIIGLNVRRRVDNRLHRMGVDQETPLNRHQPVFFRMDETRRSGADDAVHLDRLGQKMNRSLVVLDPLHHIEMQKYFLPRLFGARYNALKMDQLPLQQKNDFLRRSKRLLEFLHIANGRYHRMQLQQSQFLSPSPAERRKKYKKTAAESDTDSGSSHLYGSCSLLLTAVGFTCRFYYRSFRGLLEYRDDGLIWIAACAFASVLPASGTRTDFSSLGPQGYE